MTMAQQTEQALLDLLRDIFSFPCIHISSPLSNPAPSTSILAASITSGNEHDTITLLLSEARSASIAQLVEFLLQLLLSHPPFTHTSPDLLAVHQSRFLTIWGQDICASAVGSDHPTTDDEQKLSPQQSLKLLVELRRSFRKMSEDGFKFVSELLLSCVYRLSSGSGGSGRSWVTTHGKAVDVLSELLYSVPEAGWLQHQKDAGHITAVWKCLQLLTSGAAWWGKDANFWRSLERLARRFCRSIALLLEWCFVAGN